jgi:hypothetical protein
MSIFYPQVWTAGTVLRGKKACGRAADTRNRNAYLPTLA